MSFAVRSANWHRNVVRLSTTLYTVALRVVIWGSHSRRYVLSLEMVYPRSQTVAHPSTNPTVHGLESNSRSFDHKSDALTIGVARMVMHHYKWWINA